MSFLKSELVVKGFDKSLYHSTSVKLSREGQCSVTKFEKKSTDFITSHATKLPQFVAFKLVPIKRITGEDMRECQILSKCNHPNILKLFYWEIERNELHNKDYLHLYTELCDQNLKTFLQENQLSMTDVQKLSTQLLEGCQYLHEMGVVHRDIKPENILVYKDECPEKATLKLGDFGLSRFMPDTVESSFEYTACGTREYLSPEMFKAMTNGSHALPKTQFSTDIFSLGVVIFEMVTKRRPLQPEALLNDFDTNEIIRKNIPRGSIAAGLTCMLQWLPENRMKASDLLAYFRDDNDEQYFWCERGITCLHYLDNFDVLVAGCDDGSIYTFDKSGKSKKAFNELRFELNTIRHYGNLVAIGGAQAASLWKYLPMDATLVFLGYLVRPYYQLPNFCVGLNEKYMVACWSSSEQGYLAIWGTEEAENVSTNRPIFGERISQFPTRIEQNINHVITSIHVSYDRIIGLSDKGCFVIFDPIRGKILHEVCLVDNVWFRPASVTVSDNRTYLVVNNTVYCAAAAGEENQPIMAITKSANDLDKLFQVQAKGDSLCCLTLFGQLKVFSVKSLIKNKSVLEWENTEEKEMKKRNNILCNKINTPFGDMMQLSKTKLFCVRFEDTRIVDVLQLDKQDPDRQIQG